MVLSNHLWASGCFTPLGEQDCIISLNFDFDFSKKFMDVALSGLFKELCDSMVKSFRKRATLIYV
jgi:ribosome-associated toxin RatA of RatAB toxin-antitoxin module